MMNPIDEMHKLSNMSYDELCRLAINNFGFCPNGRHSYSKVEVITYIVAQMAIRDFFGDNLATTKEHEHEHERKRYVLDGEDGTYHVMLTKEQIDFMYWCADKGINFYDINIDEVLDIEWEKP